MSSAGLPVELAASLNPDLAGRIEYVAKLLCSTQGDVRVITHNDSDGLGAGSVMGRALQRSERSFHLSSIPDLSDEQIEKLSHDESEVTVFLDMGTSNLDAMDKAFAKAVVIDHHAGSPRRGKGTFLVNPHEHALDGAKEMCGSTMAFMVALAMDPANVDLAAVAFSGALGDRQDMGGFKGANLALLRYAESCGVIQSRLQLDLQKKELGLAIVENLDPFFKTYYSNSGRLGKDLASMGLDGSCSVERLSEKELRALSTLLSTELARTGVRTEAIKNLAKTGIRDGKRMLESRELSRLIGACGKMGDAGTGLALGMGDMSFSQKAAELRKNYDDGIRRGLAALIKNGTEAEGGIEHFGVEEHRFAGEICSIGMMYCAKQERPLLSVSIDGENAKFSARGTPYLLRRGINLSIVCREAAAKAGGRGGGHAVASGATVPSKERDTFLRVAGDVAGMQLKL